MPSLPSIPSSAAPWYARSGNAGKLYAALEFLPTLGARINANAKRIDRLSQSPAAVESGLYAQAKAAHASAVRGYLDALEAIDRYVRQAVEQGIITQDEAEQGVRQIPASGLSGPSAGTVALFSISAVVLLAIVMVVAGVTLGPFLVVALIATPLILTTIAAIDNASERATDFIDSLNRSTVNPDGSYTPPPMQQIASTAKTLIVAAGLLTALIVIPKVLKKGGKS